ncbi:MAG: ROK family protein [Bacteroidales bacterium]|nr:ROK family protein [Bacteroidales bacterium]
MKYSIGIDIGGTNTVIGLADSEGKVKRKEKFSTCGFDNAEQYLEFLKEKILSFISGVDVFDSVLGVGIGAPNGNYYRGTVEHAPNLKYKGIIQVKQILADKLSKAGCKLQVTVTNDANAAAIGEMIYGKAKDVKDFIMITLGTGVGSGIVVNGKLVYGYTGFAGEVGHTVIEPEGRLCNCGRRGCVERYASATGIVITMKEMLEHTKVPSLLRDTGSEQITSRSIYDAAVKGDKLALECFDYTAKRLALGIANAAEITSPQKIYLFGGLSKSGDYLLKPLKKYTEQYLFSIFRDTIDIELSGLNEEDAAVLGAAALCY